MLFYCKVCKQRFILSLSILPKNISHQQCKSFFRRPAKVFSIYSGHDVGISVDEFHEFLKAPETAFAEAQTCLGTNIEKEYFNRLWDKIMSLC